MAEGNTGAGNASIAGNAMGADDQMIDTVLSLWSSRHPGVLIAFADLNENEKIIALKVIQHRQRGPQTSKPKDKPKP